MTSASAEIHPSALREPFSYRGDPAVPSFPDDRPIIVFDGNCVLCSRFAQFILRHDRDRRFRLLPAQTPLGIAIYVHYGLDPINYETNLLIEDGRVWVKSEGTIRMFERLGFPWSLAALGRVFPQPIRDRAYNLIARNRLRWFGVREVCMLSAPGHDDRFLA
jgi:predicted DCC family thiol-disulfide oxidoreductase YuxK